MRRLLSFGAKWADDLTIALEYPTRLAGLFATFPIRTSNKTIYQVDSRSVGQVDKMPAAIERKAMVLGIIAI
jgi:hypothetical protein